MRAARDAVGDQVGDDERQRDGEGERRWGRESFFEDTRHAVILRGRVSSTDDPDPFHCLHPVRPIGTLSSIRRPSRMMPSVAVLPMCASDIRRVELPRVLTTGSPLNATMMSPGCRPAR